MVGTRNLLEPPGLVIADERRRWECSRAGGISGATVSRQGRGERSGVAPSHLDLVGAMCCSFWREGVSSWRYEAAFALLRSVTTDLATTCPSTPQASASRSWPGRPYCPTWMMVPTTKM